jgi:phosphoenolpyruvate synthase/pyruvate phosphate dikinase
MPEYIFDFTEGHKDLKGLLGGGGANLGLSVPPGLTISTEACRLIDLDRGIRVLSACEVGCGVRWFVW